MRALILALLLGACVSAGPIVSEPGNCSAYVPDSWREPVAGADLPDGETVADWIVFGDQQTGRLDIANGRLADTLHIVGECERRSAEAIEHSRRGFLGL